ncbi:hypothetical protein PRZ48_008759 [Zasmidium cellare]|uniref:Heterokaryon incompatibility domain-containing protein n=1 Tax=Zasmidium cellare TaxID=395010 RepID=A0ABR0EGG2_ZASCE|nr:hypothetical protein PRZ48_008759 [Zasmidium cellare]
MAFNDTANDTTSGHQPPEYHLQIGEKHSDQQHTSGKVHSELHGEDAFRLMYLMPGSGDDEIHIRLQTVFLQHSPSYEAISYVWGDVSRNESIQSETGLLYVTKNLVDALRAIRLPDRERCLWADAICIDQNNILERNHQVKQMAQLFANARNVLVWLGVDQNELALGAFHCARLLASPTRRDELLRDPDYSRHAIDLLNSLAARAWFQRIWTTQEIGLASQATCLCGGSAIEWPVLTAAYDHLIVHPLSRRFMSHTSRVRLRVLAQKWEPTTDLTFLDLLESIQNRTSTDPRDRIFALLAHPSAFLRDNNAGPARSIIEADYRLSLYQVFTRAAKGIMQQSCNLDVLSHVRRGGTPRWLPSWVPAWNEAQSASPLTSQRFLNACGASHGSFDHYMPNFSAEGELRTNGVCCDRVSHVLLDHCSLHAIFRWRDNFASIGDTSGADLEAWTDSVCQMLTDEAEPPGTSRDEMDAIGLEEIRDMFNEMGTVPKKVEQFHHLLNLVSTAMTADDQRRFFVTEAGRIGLALCGSLFRSAYDRPQAGDGVFVLECGRVPYLLRLGVGDKYRLIGDCYIESLMNGEAWTVRFARRQPVTIV